MSKEFIIIYILAIALFILCFAIYYFNPNSRMERLKSRAEKGHAKSQYYMGYILMRTNLITAQKWYEKACENGCVMAQVNYGLMLLQGTNFQQNVEQAKYWMKRAAEKGVRQAIFNMFLMNVSGEYFEKDYDEAYKWAKILAEKNDYESLKFCMFYASEKNMVNVNGKNLFAKYVMALVKQNDAEAMMVVYGNFVNIKKRKRIAYKFLKKAAKYNDEYAVKRINLLKKYQKAKKEVV